MAKINILSSDIYNKIAAGEVAERPASVVKELVENSIDAGATSISVAIENGGLLSILVADNGCGMDKEDAVKAFLPHATSKVATEDDLFSIHSLGFRGEALASIAAVSKIELISRAKENETAVKVLAEGGELQVFDCGGTVGTRILVKNLFYNTPARFKFLRKPRTEASDITNLMSRFILSKPDISFSYKIDDKVIFENTGKGLEHAIFSVYGKHTLENLVDVNYCNKSVSVTGYISRPDFVKVNSTYQTQIVNGRWVSSAKISAAISAAYREFLMPRQFPLCILNIDLPHGDVDVNVHPSKTDVRFSNGDDVFSAVYGGIKTALSKLRATQSEQFVSMIQSREQETAGKKEQQMLWRQPVVNMGYAGVLCENDKAVQDFYSVTDVDGGGDDSKTHDIRGGSHDYNNDNNENVVIHRDDNGKFGLAQKDNILSIATTTIVEDSMQSVKIVGQLFKTYIIVEYYDRFSIIDQHAAHERLLYDKYERQLVDKSVYTQLLLLPYTLTVSPTEYAYLSEKLEIFSEAGFDIEPFGNLSFVVSCVPFFLSSINFDKFFKEILSGMKSGGEIRLADGFRRYLMQKACKAAIKEGDTLSVEDIKALLNSITNEMPELYCPHGRPILREFKKSEVERWFKRT